MSAIFSDHVQIIQNFKQNSENQQKRLYIGSVYAEVTQQIHCFAYVECFSRKNFTPMYIFKLHIHPFLNKKTSK